MRTQSTLSFCSRASPSVWRFHSRPGGQDPGLQAYYWPHRTVGIPGQRRRNRQAQQQAVRPPALLRRQSRLRSRRGRSCRSPTCNRTRRREEGLPLQADATATTSSPCSSSTPTAPTSPRPDELGPQQRIIVDTTPPRVQDLRRRTTASSGWRPTTTSTRGASRSSASGRRSRSGRRSPSAPSARPTASRGSSTRARCWRCA